MAIKIRGSEGMRHGELDFEIQRGRKFVLFGVLHLRGRPHISAAFGYLLSPAG
jgi:hypothetical protein